MGLLIDDETNEKVDDYYDDEFDDDENDDEKDLWIKEMLMFSEEDVKYNIKRSGWKMTTILCDDWRGVMERWWRGFQKECLEVRRLGMDDVKGLGSGYWLMIFW